MESIIIFVKNLAKGGAEKQAVLLARSLCKDFEVHVVVFEGDVIHESYKAMLASPDIILHQLYGGFLSKINQTKQLFIDLKPKAVFSYLTGANAIAAYLGHKTGVNVVTGIRSAKLPFLKMLADRYITNKLATMTVSNSFSGRQAFVSRGFQAARMTVIPNCFENITPLHKKEQSDKITVITVGRFVPEKDFATAISSVALAAESYNNLHFVIVGYGKLESDIRKMVVEKGIEHITDILIDPPGIPDLLDQSDIYLSTSTFEGTSNSVIEAMNANLPIVATAVGDNPRMVSDNNGCLCSVRDVNSLSNAIVQIARSYDERIRMGAESKRLLIEMFSSEQFRDNYINLINSLP